MADITELLTSARMVIRLNDNSRQQFVNAVDLIFCGAAEKTCEPADNGEPIIVVI